MPASHPIELRDRVVRAYIEDGLSARKVAALFRVGVTSVYRFASAYRAGLSLEPGVAPGAVAKLRPAHDDWLRAQLELNPYVTSYELTRQFNRRFRSLKVHRSTVLRAMHRVGFSHKKRPR